MSNKRALLVCNTYSGANFLEGPKHDLENFKNYLLENDFTEEQIVGLLGASIDDVRRELANVLKYCNQVPNVSVVVYFSGHGVGTADKDGDEDDNQDENMVLNSQAGLQMYSDDLFKSEFINLLPRDVTCWVICDACQSGTFSDLRYKWKDPMWVPSLRNSVGIPGSSNNLLQAKSQQQFSEATVLNLAGCMDSGYSADLGKAGGALTKRLLETLRHNNHSMGFGDLIRTLSANLRVFGQTPILTASRKLPRKFAWDFKNHSTDEDTYNLAPSKSPITELASQITAELVPHITANVIEKKIDPKKDKKDEKKDKKEDKKDSKKDDKKDNKKEDKKDNKKDDKKDKKEDKKDKKEKKDSKKDKPSVASQVLENAQSLGTAILQEVQESVLPEPPVEAPVAVDAPAPAQQESEPAEPVRGLRRKKKLLDIIFNRKQELASKAAEAVSQPVAEIPEEAPKEDPIPEQPVEPAAVPVAAPAAEQIEEPTPIIEQQVAADPVSDPVSDQIPQQVAEQAAEQAAEEVSQPVDQVSEPVAAPEPEIVVAPIELSPAQPVDQIESVVAPVEPSPVVSEPVAEQAPEQIPEVAQVVSDVVSETATQSAQPAADAIEQHSVSELISMFESSIEPEISKPPVAIQAAQAVQLAEPVEPEIIQPTPIPPIPEEAPQLPASIQSLDGLDVTLDSPMGTKNKLRIRIKLSNEPEIKIDFN